jgi:3-hydroxyacyl-[acyl-carrier-protein] dehydratase
MAQLDIKDIHNLIPHRYPFLLVDRVLEVNKERIISIKNVSINEEFFNGHFPGNPIMPGVLQVEAMAQSACLLLMHEHIEDIENSLIVFSKIANAKFKKTVVPGDQLNMNLKLINKRRNFVTMEGKATVDGDIACQLEATAAIVSNN